MIVSIDLLINGISSRTTDASFSFEELDEHSKQRKIEGIEKEVTVLVPDKEILVALKLHSGRLTDFRDIVALSKNLKETLVKEIIWREKKTLLKKILKNY